jgi:septum formation protein
VGNLQSPLSLPDAPPVVLASASRSRGSMLEAAGVVFTTAAAGVDEDEVKRALRAEGASPMNVAETLAELKAQQVSRRHPGALVIGGDQVLECNDVLFDKPPDRAHARGHLLALRAKNHKLHASVCVVRDGEYLWHANDTAELAMRDLSDAYIDAYLEAIGDDALLSVGAYQLEGIGAQLFTRVRGDFFTILGMPLLPLLEFLRGQGVLVR